MASTKEIQKVLIKEARLKLSQLNGAKEYVEIIERFARYSQTLNIIKTLGDALHPKDKESALALNADSIKKIDAMEEEVMAG